MSTKTSATQAFDWLVVIAVVAVLIAVLMPPVQWASSGEIKVPVQVQVLDERSGIPVVGAAVALFRSPPPESNASRSFEGELPLAIFDGDENPYLTTSDVNGLATITYPFRTGANHERPESHAHTRWVWVAVRAEKNRDAVVQVRQNSLPTAQLKQLKVLQVSVAAVTEE